jgi:hypothetical protein
VSRSGVGDEAPGSVVLAGIPFGETEAWLRIGRALLTPLV